MRWVIECWNNNDIEPERYLAENYTEFINWFKTNAKYYTEIRTITVAALKELDLKNRIIK